ncbi:MAG: hypothetical protein PUD92_07800 [Clostridiales bacterium]|nr:hypothetical protein [Clostridiales bacterium]
MKKVLFCMALTSAVLSGATAMANGDYSSDNNSVTITDAGSTTVLITKNTGTAMTDDDIVYVGQNDNGFSAAATFFLKESPAAGFYTITLGNQTGAPKSADFVIGDASDVFTQEATLTELSDSEVVNADNTVTKSFVSDAPITFSDIKTIVVTCDGKSVYSSVDSDTELSGGGSAQIGVRISGLTQGSNVSVYISSDSVPTSGN